MEKGLWGLTNGGEADPGENATAKIKSADTTRDVTSTEKPKEAWKILHNQFHFVSMAQTVRITRRFYAATMKEDGDLQQHLTLMSSLAQQLS